MLCCHRSKQPTKWRIFCEGTAVVCPVKWRRLRPLRFETCWKIERPRWIPVCWRPEPELRVVRHENNRIEVSFDLNKQINLLFPKCCLLLLQVHWFYSPPPPNNDCYPLRISFMPLVLIESRRLSPGGVSPAKGLVFYLCGWEKIHYKKSVWVGEGLENLWHRKSPKSTLLADNTQGLITTKKNKVVASAASHYVCVWAIMDNILCGLVTAGGRPLRLRICTLGGPWGGGGG